MKTAVATDEEPRDWREVVPVWVILRLDKGDVPNWREKFLGINVSVVDFDYVKNVRVAMVFLKGHSRFFTLR